MIVNLFLLVLQGVVNIVLAPLTALNFVVDVASSIPIVSGFIKVVAYLFPWRQIVPLIFLVVAIFGFRIVVSLIKTIWNLIPFV